MDIFHSEKDEILFLNFSLFYLNILKNIFFKKTILKIMEKNHSENNGKNHSENNGKKTF